MSWGDRLSSSGSIETGMVGGLVIIGVGVALGMADVCVDDFCEICPSKRSAIPGGTAVRRGRMVLCALDDGLNWSSLSISWPKTLHSRSNGGRP